MREERTSAATCAESEPAAPAKTPLLSLGHWHRRITPSHAQQRVDRSRNRLAKVKPAQPAPQRWRSTHGRAGVCGGWRTARSNGVRRLVLSRTYPPYSTCATGRAGQRAPTQGAGAAYYAAVQPIIRRDADTLGARLGPGRGVHPPQGAGNAPSCRPVPGMMCDTITPAKKIGQVRRSRTPPLYF